MNETLQGLERDEVAVGSWLLSGSARAAEVLSRTAVDWVGIDTEHAPYSAPDVEAMVRAVEGAATPIVRLPSVDDAAEGAAKRALDAGAGGIIVPGVESAADAERVVRAAYFPPHGDRGVAGTVRANGYGQSFDAYVAEAAAETLVAVQLETQAGIDRVEDIVAVDGIDVAFVGENDLSAALGHPGEKDHPAVVDAVDRVLEAAGAADVRPGIAARTPADLQVRTDRGFRFILLGADLSFLRRGVQSFLSG